MRMMIQRRQRLTMQRTVAGPYRLLMPHVDNAEDGCWSIQIAHAACTNFTRSVHSDELYMDEGNVGISNGETI